jgi:hypothetical protein
MIAASANRSTPTDCDFSTSSLVPARLFEAAARYSTACAAYRQFRANPSHPGLQFKALHTKVPLWSVRVTNSYRAVDIRKTDDEIVWFFIGTHAEYDRLLADL